ncbi:hypothetical protein MnTg02_02086 [bacterium MnTg02]|nr:hypothetical protein MnTg02_02086 [bacterium MnTg02]
MVVKADAFGDAPGEKAESSRNKETERPVMTHGLNKRPCSRLQRDAFLVNAFKQTAFHSFHQRHALAQGIGKAHVAANDGRSDLPDLRTKADGIAEFINTFLVYKCGVHVGNEKFLSPSLDAGAHRI